MGDVVTSGEKAPLGWILRNIRLGMRTPKETSRQFRSRHIVTSCDVTSGHMTFGHVTDVTSGSSTPAHANLSVPIYYSDQLIIRRRLKLDLFRTCSVRK